MLCLLGNRSSGLCVLFLTLTFWEFGQSSNVHAAGACYVCGIGNEDDCPSSSPPVKCKQASICFKMYNTSINRLQMGCSEETSETGWNCINKLSPDRSNCYDVTATNLALISQCQQDSNFSGSFVPASQALPPTKVQDMTSKKCVCKFNKTEDSACNVGDVPGFEEIQRAKVEVNQCYDCGERKWPPCGDLKDKETAKWCRSKFCKVSKKRENRGYTHLITGRRLFDIIVKRACADYYEDPAKAFECIKREGKGSCMDVKKLRNCAPIKPGLEESKDVVDYDEESGEDAMECICEGALCNVKNPEEIPVAAIGPNLFASSTLFLVWLISILGNIFASLIL